MKNDKITSLPAITDPIVSVRFSRSRFLTMVVRTVLCFFLSFLLCISPIRLDAFGLLDDVSFTENNTAHAATYPTKIINGDFSYPWLKPNGATALPSKTATDFLYIEYQDGDWLGATPVGGSTWSTGRITGFRSDLFGWKSDNDMVKHPWLKDIVEVQGDDSDNVCGELISDAPGYAIYQDISTQPGAVYKWKLDHTSIDATHADRMSVLIGTTSKQNAQNAYRTKANGSGDKAGFVGTVITTYAPKNKNNIKESGARGWAGWTRANGWETYEGSYLVPDGQTVTRFTFKDVEGYGATAGNLVDNISFEIAYPVKYNLNNGTQSAGVIETPYLDSNGIYQGYYTEGASVPLPVSSKMSRSGHTFLGWSRIDRDDIASKLEYDSASSTFISSYNANPSHISSSNNMINLYAIWADNPTLSFDTGAGSKVSSQTYSFGGTTTKPTASPMRAGYRFGGWYSDAQCTQEYRFGQRIYENDTAYAKWIPIKSGLSLEKTVSLSKDADGDGQADFGDTLSYSFKVTNTGECLLTDVSISDPMLNGGEPISVGTLLTGVSSTVAGGTHTVSANEAKAGKVSNTATVTGTPPEAVPVPTATDTAEIATEKPNPSLSLEKTTSIDDANGDKKASFGETVSYTFVVRNTGNVSVSDISVADPMLGDAKISVGALAPGESKAVSAPNKHTVSADEARSGTLVNTATATGTASSGGSVSATDTASIATTVPAPALTLDKTHKVSDSNGDGAASFEEEIVWSFTVRNAGNVSIDGIAIADERLGISKMPVGALAPGEEKTVSAPAHNVTASEASAGTIDNTATATGTAASGGTVSASGADTVKTTVPSPSIELVKKAELRDVLYVNGLADAGETVAYSFIVRNTGNIRVESISINDPALGISGLSVGAIEPGSEKTISAPSEHAVTYAEAKTGKVTNAATASGVSADGKQVSDTATASLNANLPSPAVSIEKKHSLSDANGDGKASFGETIAYSFIVRNEGDVALEDVAIDDQALGVHGLVVGSLAVGEEKTVAAPSSKTVSYAEAGSGSVSNTADVSGTAGGGIDKVSGSDTDTIATTVPEPSVSIEKVAALDDADEDGLASYGEAIFYSFSVSNTGNVALECVSVSDEALGIEALAIGDLAVGETKTIAAPSKKTVSYAEAASGGIRNTATATGIAGGKDAVEASDTVETETEIPAPALSLEKTADVPGGSIAHWGDELGYSFTVSNTGNIALANVMVSDPQVALDGIEIGDLAVGETKTVKIEDAHRLTIAEALAGAYSNTAVASGTDPGGSSAEAFDTEIVDVAVPVAGVSLVKSARISSDADGDGRADYGDALSYEFVVTNTGDVPLSNAFVSDPLLPGAEALSVGSLAVGESKTVDAAFDFIVDAETAYAGVFENTASVSADAPTPMEPVSSSATHVQDIEIPEPSVAIEKTHRISCDADGDGRADLADRIVWSFTVRNTGNIVLHDVRVDDPKVSGDPIFVADELSPGEEIVVDSPEYTVDAEDAREGVVRNTASAIVSVPDGIKAPSASDDDEVESEVPEPRLEADKLAARSVVSGDDAKAGEEVKWIVSVRNKGNVRIDGISIEDALELSDDGGMSDWDGTLEAGESATFVVSHRLTQDEVDAGRVVNVVSATGEALDGTGMSAESPESVVRIVPDACLLLKKTADKTSLEGGEAVEGAKIRYSFELRNDGAATVSAIRVFDALHEGDADDLAYLVESGAVSEADGALFSRAAGDAGALGDIAFAGEDGCEWDGVLVPGESVSGTAEYTVSLDDVARGDVVNAVVAVGNAAGGSDIRDNGSVSAGAVARTEIEKRPALSVEKSAPARLEGVVAGDAVPYAITVANTGNVLMEDVVVHDALEARDGFRWLGAGGGEALANGGIGAPCIGDLAPGENVVVYAEYAVEDDDIRNGFVANSVNAIGMPAGESARIESDPSSVRTELVGESGTASLSVTGSGRAFVGFCALAGFAVIASAAACAVIGTKRKKR